MHALLREFIATAGREPDQAELRALTQPIYRVLSASLHDAFRRAC
jgi:hypothetical protein